jgi:hypothetical protein
MVTSAIDETYVALTNGRKRRLRNGTPLRKRAVVGGDDPVKRIVDVLAVPLPSCLAPPTVIDLISLDTGLLPIVGDVEPLLDDFL